VEKSDFSIFEDGCTGYQWGPGDYGTSCYYYFTFNPTTTGPRNAEIDITQSGNCTDGSGTEYVYGAGVTLTPALLFAMSNFSLEFPIPQDPDAPFSAGYNSLMFDSDDASVLWTPKIKYQTSGKIPTIAAMPSPVPTPFPRMAHQLP